MFLAFADVALKLKHVGGVFKAAMQPVVFSVRKANAPNRRARGNLVLAFSYTGTNTAEVR
ncbi:MAG: hypothetical protein ACRBBQ_12195 [Cognatishimia sp.]